MFMFLLLLQSASLAPPDLEIGATVRARSVRIEKRGNAQLTVTSEPEGGNVVDVRAPKANGRRTVRDVEVNVRGEARIGDPARQTEQNRADKGQPK